MLQNETIFSLVTKPISQNVAIIRISGPKTFEVIEKMFNTKFNFEQSTKILFKKLFINNNFVDDVVLLLFKNPNSFTGEDVIELQFHGSIFIIEKIIDELLNHKLIQAKPGEFTQRAFLNNKLDLSQATSINTLINAQTKFLADQASRNLNREQSLYIESAIKKLEEIIATIHVNIDYPENTDLPMYSNEQILKELEHFNIELEKIIENSTRMIKVSDGIKITFLGIPNAGKSTLLNSIIKEDKAIVSDIPGTTRDIVESSFFLDGIKITFNDTAGFRETKDTIENLGIKKTLEALEKSDIIILLLDSNSSLSIAAQEKLFSKQINLYKDKIIKVITKQDLLKSKTLDNDYIYISAKNNEVKNLVDHILKFIKQNLFEFDEKMSILITKDQVLAFKQTNDLFQKIIFELKNNDVLLDVILFELENVLRKFLEMIGKEMNEEYISNLFQNFCIGK